MKPLAIALLACAALPALARAEGRVAFLADEGDRALLAPALRMELATQALELVEADEPPGATRLARAASAQALAEALGARAALWLDSVEDGIIVRVVPAADGEPRQAPLPAIAEGERPRIFALVAASLLGELEREPGTPPASVTVEVRSAPALDVPPPPLGGYGGTAPAVPYEDPSLEVPLETVGVVPYLGFGIAGRALLADVRSLPVVGVEVFGGLRLGRFFTLSIGLELGTYWDEGGGNVQPFGGSFRGLIRPTIELGFVAPLAEGTVLVMGPRTVVLAAERPFFDFAACVGGCPAALPIAYQWTWGLGFGGFVGPRIHVESGFDLSILAHVDGQFTVGDAYVADADLGLSIRAEVF